jgi:hypothetical protein
VKFDVETRDQIQKRESIKLWEAINSLQAKMSELNAKESIEGEVDFAVDEKLERELDALNTKISK